MVNNDDLGIWKIPQKWDKNAAAVTGRGLVGSGYGVCYPARNVRLEPACQRAATRTQKAALNIH